LFYEEAIDAEADIEGRYILREEKYLFHYVWSFYTGKGEQEKSCFAVI
jgi:hypothetical protein